MYLDTWDQISMMTSSNRNIFHIFPLEYTFVRGIHRWIPSTKASDAELWYFLWSAWINGWVNNGEAGDLRRHCAHYLVTVMSDTWIYNHFHTGKWSWKYRLQNGDHSIFSRPQFVDPYLPAVTFGTKTKFSGVTPKNLATISTLSKYILRQLQR